MYIYIYIYIYPSDSYNLRRRGTFSSICIIQPTTTSRSQFTICTYTVIILCIVFPRYTFLWPEDGPHWPKHVVVSTINKIQDSCVLTYRTPSLNNYFLPQHQLKILLTSHKSSFAARCTYLCTYTTGTLKNTAVGMKWVRRRAGLGAWEKWQICPSQASNPTQFLHPTFDRPVTTLAELPLFQYQQPLRHLCAIFTLWAVEGCCRFIERRCQISSQPPPATR